MVLTDTLARSSSYPNHQLYGLVTDHAPVFAWTALPRDEEPVEQMSSIDVELHRRTAEWLPQHSREDLVGVQGRIRQLGFYTSSVALIQ